MKKEDEIIKSAMSLMGKRSIKSQKAIYGKNWSVEMARRGAIGLKARYSKLKESGIAKDNLSTDR